MTSVCLRVPVMTMLAMLWVVLGTPVVAQPTPADTVAADTAAAAMTAFPAAEAPLRGVVWEVPADADRAVADLRQMAVIGVQAVRTGLVEDTRLLTLADSLGLRLFQELPLAFAPAPVLAESLAAVQRRLDAALARARRHPSARHFGLARSSDTSDPAACAALGTAADRVRAALQEARVYYITPFVARDQCGAAVDFVLLDALDVRVPEARLAAWRAAHPDVPAGIGAFGMWVGDARGLAAAHSPEAQARYLENALGALLADSVAAPAIFVHRWRDQARGETDPLPALHGVRGRRYGLLTREGVPRPAFAVVRGRYTGTQDVFAFERGTPEASSGTWAILLGWGLALLLGVFYALSSRFRHMTSRYFRAHGFYREAVREGRDVLLGTSALLLLVVSVSVGIVVTVAVRALREEQAFALLVRWLPADVQVSVAGLLTQPIALVFLCASVYAVALILWASVLSLTSRRRHLLAPGQVVILIVWPRWTMLLLAVGAIVVSTMPVELARQGALILLAAWVVTALYAILRTLYDYAAITRVPPQLVLAAGVGNPLVLLLLIGFFFFLEHRARVSFLVHLARGG